MRFEFCKLTIPGYYAHVSFNIYFGATKAETAYKQPQRSNMASELNSVYPITQVTMLHWPLYSK